MRSCECTSVYYCLPGSCAFQAETFSAQEMVQARFSQPDALVDLEELMNEIFTRRADRVPTIPYVPFNQSPNAYIKPHLVPLIFECLPELL